MAIPMGHKQNFDTLIEAVRDGNVALMECQLAATGETVAVICAVNRLPNEEAQFVPFAMFFNGNPYEALNPPKPEGGFETQGKE
jgi:hypothetical protein